MQWFIAHRKDEVDYHAPKVINACAMMALGLLLGRGRTGEPHIFLIIIQVLALDLL